MTEFSQPWTGTSTGDAGAYSHTQWSNMWKRLFLHLTGGANWGVISGSHDSNLPPLEVYGRTPAAASVSVRTGAAFVNGKYYFSDAIEVLSISANLSGSDRIDTVVLQSIYTSQTIRLAVIEGTPAATPVAPSLTQTDGVQWEVPLADIYVANGFTTIDDSVITDRRVVFVPGNAPQTIQVHRLSDSTISVEIGQVNMMGQSLIKAAVAILDMTDGDDWIDGSSGEAASEFAHVYMSQDGRIRLHNKFPSYPAPTTDSLVFTAAVNQVGWNGTSGSGLNATTVTYDADSGEDAVQAGMLLGILDTGDTDLSDFRAKGSAGGHDTKYWSWARITAINTGANTLTLESGHAIAINDNDLLFAVQPGDIRWRLEGTTWWYYLGSVYNNASSNLVNRRSGKRDRGELSATFTTSSTSEVQISANLDLQVINTHIADLQDVFHAHGLITAPNVIYVYHYLDTLVRPPSDHANTEQYEYNNNTANPTTAGVGHFVYRDVMPGQHTLTLTAKVSAGTGSIYTQANMPMTAHHEAEVLQ